MFHSLKDSISKPTHRTPLGLNHRLSRSASTLVVVALSIVLSLFAEDAFSQKDKKVEQEAGTESDAEQKEEKPAPWAPPPLKSFSASESKAECKKYEGKIISYYSKLYMIENCLRREILDHDTVRKVHSKYKILTVSGETIIKLKEGEPKRNLLSGFRRKCQSLENKYVISGSSDIFYIESCKRRGFPDWETYIDHRKKKKKKNESVIDLNQTEFESLALGEPYPTILDEAFRKKDGSSKVIDLMIQATPLKRMAEPLEIAQTIAFFVSSESAFITGQVLSVSGGLTMVD